MGKFMTEFLEKLVKDIHVDLESDEIKDLHAAVTELLQRIFVNVENVYPFFKSTKIVPCGSMAEGTRMYKFTPDDKTAMIEFDFLAILQYFTPDSFIAKDACGGFMEVEDTHKVFPQEYVNADADIGPVGMISTKRLSFNYRLEIMKAVSTLCNCHELPTDVHMRHGVEVIAIKAIKKTEQYREECDKCKVRKDAGTLIIGTGLDLHPMDMNCTIIFVWKRNIERGLESPCELSRQAKHINQEYIIPIDFLPAIEVVNLPTTTTIYTRSKEGLEVQTPQVNRADNSPFGHQCFLVPKGCKAEHCSCWKVSHCEFEKQLLRSTSQVHRNCYIALKFILDYILSDLNNVQGMPTTYVLKTAVLYHITRCSLAEPDLTTCCTSIAQALSDAHTDTFMPHLILKDQNFLSAPSTDKDFFFLKEHVTWSQNRNRLMGKCWTFIIRVLEQMDSILPSGFNFDTIQTILKFTTIIYGRAYKNTTFNVIHEPDDDKLLAYHCGFAENGDLPGDIYQNVIKISGDLKNKWAQEVPPERYGHAGKLFYRMGHHDVPKQIDEALSISFWGHMESSGGDISGALQHTMPL